MNAGVEQPASAAYRPETLGSLWARIDRGDLTRLAVVAGLAVIAALASWLAAPWWLTAGIAAVGLVAGCWPIIIEAWHDIRSRRMSMELSMLIAIFAAALIGEWVTALVITVFVLAAEILEDLTMDRGRDALTDLMSFLPARIQVRDGDQVREIDLDEVAVGDLVVVRPGGRVPVDGLVVEGRSSLDQSRITGESLPVDVNVGASVFAGSVNSNGALIVRAQRVGETSSYGRIVAAVKAAQESEAPVQRLADRVAGWLVYIALGGALITYLITHNLRATISVVIVAGACGVAAGTPLAVLAAIARIARRGAFVKDGTHLEQLSEVHTVVFDKTGTLTVGEPAVTVVRPAAGFGESELLAAVASAELFSEHSIGRAIVECAQSRGITVVRPDEFRNEPGVGVTAHLDGRRIRAGNASVVAGAVPEHDLGTAVYVTIDDVYAGMIVLSDTVRESARDGVARLQRLGLQVVMMSGDNLATARSVADELGITEVHAELLPSDKVRLVEQLRGGGTKVAMVGDGVNDAPALAGPDVGIAMGTGTHIARESADVVLISSSLSDLAGTIETARWARRIVLTNFVGTIVVDLIGMVMAAFGLLGPLLAAIVHVSSESVFILNSARLIPRRADSRQTVVAGPRVAADDNLMRRFMRGLAHLMPARADGTNPVAVRAFHRMDALRDRFRRHQTSWPVTNGAYAVGDPQASVAIATLTSDELYPDLAQTPGVAIAGRVVVPNLGIEKIIRNIVANPSIRHLVVCGQESPVFHPGEALRQLHTDGVDDERRIIGARGHLPVLANVSREQIETFRSQVQLVDLVGETDPTAIRSRASALASERVAAFVSSVGDSRGDNGERFATIPAGGRREPLAYDPKGFFVITIEPDSREIEVLHYLPDNTPGHRIRGHSAEAILYGLTREGLISQLSHAGYLGAELAKAETAMRLGLDYHQDRPLRG